MNFLANFGRFWYDFIVGDSVVLAIGGVLVVGLAWALQDLGAAKVAEFVLPIAVVGTLWFSLPRGRN